MHIQLEASLERIEFPGPKRLWASQYDRKGWDFPRILWENPSPLGLKPQGLELNLQRLRCNHIQNMKQELEHASIRTFSKQKSKVSQ